MATDVDTDEGGPLDRCAVTKRVRDAARLAGVTGDDAVRRWHARTSRRLAAALARLHGFTTPAESAAGSHEGQRR